MVLNEKWIILKEKKRKEREKRKVCSSIRVYLFKKEELFKSCLEVTEYVFVTVDCPFSQEFP